MVQGVIETRGAWRPSGGAAPADAALAWCLAWLGAVLAAGFGIAAAHPHVFGQLAAALLAGAGPAALGLLLPRRDGEGLRALLLVAFGVGGCAACVLAGGLAGPLAAWCLAPVAAASALGGTRRLAEGAALSLMAAAVAALAGLAGLVPPEPTHDAAFWMGLLSLATTGLGLGAGLVMSERRAGWRESRHGAELARLQQALGELPQMVVTLHPSGRPRSLFGRAPRGIVAETVFRHGLEAAAAPEGRAAVAQALAQAIVRGEGLAAFPPAQALDRWASMAVRRIDEDLLIAVISDATDQHGRELSLAQGKADAEALAAGKSRFLANMSHELRTPLNAIMGFSDIMRSRMFGALPDRYAEYGDLIHESGSHLLDLINDVLDMSKIEAERFQLSREVFDAREAVSAALRLMRLQADGVGVQLRGVLPPTPLDVDADRRALKQITLNLVSNALKFTPKGGSVTVTSHGYDGVFELVVSDTGVGISPEDLERLGRPYEQADAGRRAQGTGLGLSLVRAFAELHGGEMVIESTQGDGTTVSIRLPVLVPQSEVPPSPLGDNVIAFNPQR